MHIYLYEYSLILRNTFQIINVVIYTVIEYHTTNGSEIILSFRIFYDKHHTPIF